MAESAPLFDDGRAERYDRIISRIVVGYEAMHRLARAAVLLEPEVRQVLVVGIGTGEETVALANDLPDATFVGVDVSADMLALAREKIAVAGLDGRVDLILGDACQAPDGPYEPLWRAALGLGFDAEKVEDIVQGFHEDVHAIEAEQHLADMAGAGFSDPVEVFRSLFVRMWTARA